MFDDLIKQIAEAEMNLKKCSEAYFYADCDKQNAEGNLRKLKTEMNDAIKTYIYTAVETEKGKL